MVQLDRGIYMTLTEAYRNVREFYNKSNPNESDEFILVESLAFIIAETKEKMIRDLNP